MIRLLAALFLFTLNAIAQAGEPLRVMTYNIHHGEGTDQKFDLGRIAKLILAQKPDLVAIQEVDVKTTRASGVDQAAELAKLTGMHHAFGKFMDYSGGEYGQMVLSKYPIKRSRNFKLPAGAEPRASIAIEIEIAGEKLVFVGNHFYATEAQRSAQAEKLIEHLQPELETNTHIILAGDFNSEPGSKPMGILAKHWPDPTAEKNIPTWPSGEPKVEIDHILFSPAKRFKFVKSEVIEEKIASDHRPVVTVLELAGEAEDK
ncbi:MAG: endonuclease/exonuclease/phosphatase family metal-dependent hydrolase [Verrucomicrobiales bacterium]